MNWKVPINNKPRNPCIKHAYIPILFWSKICCRSWSLLSDQSDMKLIILFIFLYSVECRASCPPPPGESPPPGCSLTFIQDQGGEIDCQEDEDCPYRWGLPTRTTFLISRSVWIGGHQKDKYTVTLKDSKSTNAWVGGKKTNRFILTFFLVCFQTISLLSDAHLSRSAPNSSALSWGKHSPVSHKMISSRQNDGSAQRVSHCVLTMLSTRKGPFEVSSNSNYCLREMQTL